LAVNTVQVVAGLKCSPTQTWTDQPGDNEDRPINCLTWYEAMAFCMWDGGYLPSEAEWNYAAAGGDLQRAYPWSSRAAPLVLDGSHASYNDGTDCVGDGMAKCLLTDLVVVGSKPLGDGRWGHSDLAGNVFEWTLDWYAAVYPNPCADCAELIAGPTRGIRGGSYLDTATYQRTGARNYDGPANRVDYVGVRCARSAP